MGTNSEKLVSGYRYGFNGMEKDDEVKGEGNSYDFGARIYDSRLGRWLSLDPLATKYPSLSPYHSFANNPVLFVDPDGKENTIYLIVATNSNGEPTIKKEDAQKIVDKANEYLIDLGVTTRVVLYNRDVNSINFNAIDKTDMVSIVGNTKQDVASFLKGKTEGTDEEWLGGWAANWAANPANPEASDGSSNENSNKFSLIGSEESKEGAMSDDKSSSTALMLVHGAGHVAGSANGDNHKGNGDHADGVGFMKDGNGIRFELKKLGGKIKSLFSNTNYDYGDIKKDFKNKFSPNGEKHNPTLNN